MPKSNILHILEETLRKMVSCGAEVSALTLNGVIHACTQAGDIERAEMYLNGMDVRLCAGYVPLSLRMWDLFRDSLEC